MAGNPETESSEIRWRCDSCSRLNPTAIKLCPKCGGTRTEKTMAMEVVVLTTQAPALKPVPGELTPALIERQFNLLSPGERLRLFLFLGLTPSITDEPALLKAMASRLPELWNAMYPNGFGPSVETYQIVPQSMLQTCHVEMCASLDALGNLRAKIAGIGK